ncbi:MAG: hypothetical protein JWO03_1735 [Bacteroidetes bacterium]|nr:hypothetical protein [Bacteroidota bacterium]
MLRISTVFFLLFSFSCVAQSDTAKRNSPTPKNFTSGNSNMTTDVDYFGKYSKQLYYDLAESLAHDVDTFWRYDAKAKRYRTNAHFIELLTSKYGQLLLHTDAVDLDAYLSRNINPSTRYLLNEPIDSAIGYISYPIVCDGCLQKSKGKRLYLVYYNAKGKILRQGVAYWRKGKMYQTQ